MHQVHHHEMRVREAFPLLGEFSPEPRIIASAVTAWFCALGLESTHFESMVFKPAVDRHHIVAELDPKLQASTGLSISLSVSFQHCINHDKGDVDEIASAYVGGAISTSAKGALVSMVALNTDYNVKTDESAFKGARVITSLGEHRTYRKSTEMAEDSTREGFIRVNMDINHPQVAGKQKPEVLTGLTENQIFEQLRKDVERVMSYSNS